MLGMGVRAHRIVGMLIFGTLALWVMNARAEPISFEVVKAEVGFYQRTGEPILNITLSEAARRSFSQLTAANVGRKTEVRVDGKIVAQPVIREPILGGIVQISGHFKSVDEAQAMAKRLSTAGARIEIEIAPD